MESDAVLSLYESMFYDSKKRITLRSIVSNDESTMRTLLKHPGNHKEGKFNPEIPEPSWLVDPSHRTKVVAKYMFALAALPKSKSTCTKIDAVRVKKYFSYMIKTNRDRTTLKIKIASLAVIEHLFDSNVYCNSRWCRPKRIIELREKIRVSKDEDDIIKDNEKLTAIQRTVHSFYRCKVKDKVIYQQMKDAYQPFTNEERLQESLHSYSTQKNEAMNNCVAKYAPKTRTYSTTMALTNTVMIAIGTSNLEYVTYWERVFSDLDLIMNTDTKSFLIVKDQNHTYRKKHNEKIKTKQRRVEMQNQKMKELMVKQRIDDARGATYGAGVAIESDTFQIQSLIKEKKPRRKRRLN